jgi:hypothetical protein
MGSINLNGPSGNQTESAMSLRQRLKDHLGLRHERDRTSRLVRYLGLPDHGAPTAMNRGCLTDDFAADRSRRQEVGLRFNRGRAGIWSEVEHGLSGTQRVGEGHQRHRYAGSPAGCTVLHGPGVQPSPDPAKRR